MEFDDLRKLEVALAQRDEALAENARLRAELSAYAGTNTNLINDLVLSGMARESELAVTDEKIEAGAQALVNDHWHPPQKLAVIGKYEADKYRRQARLVLEAALQNITKAR